MKLSAKAILTYNHINSFSFGNQWTIRSGEPNTLYFQIVDLDQASLRYLVGYGGPNQPASINVTFPSIEEDDIITIAAVQVDAADTSLWKISLTDEQVPMSGNVVFSITEGSTTRRFSMLAFIAVESVSGIGDCC